MARPRVVILGAGFAGLTAARGLARAPVDVVLVERNNYHLFTPLLYQVASALLDPSSIARPVRSLVRRLGNVELRMAEVTGVDLGGRTVRAGGEDVAYDYLVIATGSATNFFGNRSLRDRARGLKELPEALDLRNATLSEFEAAALDRDPVRRRRRLTFVVVGGGPTGVEYAGALRELVNLELHRDFPELDLGQVRVVLLEASARLLAPFHPRLREAALRSLQAKGVEVWLSASVAEVTEGAVRLRDGRELEGGTVVWTAGVEGSALGRALGVALAPQSRVPVGPTLQLEGHPEVFVVGDLAAVEADAGGVLPMLIPVALQEARTAARSIAALVAGRSAQRFRFRDRGSMATIGRNSGVAELGRLRLSGFPGWVMWLVVHLANTVTFRARLLVLLSWAWNYVLHDRPVRLILAAQGTGKPRPWAGPGPPDPPPA